ncbi:MAG: RNB domain-containing ribonuclease, partial [Gemmatimonadaceae bacterium]
MTDLRDVALQALHDNGFATDLEADAKRELNALRMPGDTGVRDLRALLWSSIDNAESKDLDQIEFAEETIDGGVRLRVGIADVDVAVPKGSALDRHAMTNATSVYTGIAVYPMLPPEISTGATSLNEGEERIVLVIELVIAPNGTVTSHDVYRAIAQ